MHRRKEIFGSDAACFRPERWLENSGELVSSVGYGYLPFNAGPRICLGRKSVFNFSFPCCEMIPADFRDPEDFALTEASYLVICMLQRFRHLSLPADEPVEAVGDERQKLTLVLGSVDGCRVVLSP